MASTHSHGPHDHHDHDHGHGHHHHDHGGPPVAAQDFNDPAQGALVGALHSSFRVLRLLMVVLVVLYVFSGAFVVKSGEQGLIVRFGQLRNSEKGTPVFEPGLHIALPDPFEEKIRLEGSVRTLNVTTFLFRASPTDLEKPLAEIRPNNAEIKPGTDGCLVTGDRNLSHGLFTVVYQIADGAKFVRNIADTADDFEPLLQRLTEAAVIQEVSRRRVEEVTYEAMGSVAAGVQTRLQTLLDSLETGVKVNEIRMKATEPGRVSDAYQEVTLAENEKKNTWAQARRDAERRLNEVAGASYEPLIKKIDELGAAQTVGADAARVEQIREEINELLAKAGGEVAKKLQFAESVANSQNQVVRSEMSEFQSWLAQYKKYPRITVLTLWTKTIADILESDKNEILYVPDQKEIEIWINRDPELLQQREIKRITQQQTGGH